MKPYDYAANKSKLVDPSTGRRLTAALFKETSVTPHLPVVFSLEEWRKVYVDIADPTEYRSAMALIGDWDHWKMIVENQSVKPFIELWRDEVAVKLKSEAFASLRKLSHTKDSAAKTIYLGEGGAKRGRPLKEKKPVEYGYSPTEDMKRLGLDE